MWEQAYQLGSRGQFLPEEAYSDWAKPRREEQAGQYRQCVHRLATLLRERCYREQALLRLRTYWQANPTDEDVLRPLMELLGEQERYQEAEDYYQQCSHVIIEAGDGPQLDPRTEDLRAFLHTKQLQRDFIEAKESTPFVNALSPSYTLLSNREERTDVDRLDTSPVFPTSSPGELSNVQHLSYGPTQLFSLHEIEPETLERFTVLTETCRHFSEGSELKTAERLLWSYLPRVEIVAKLSLRDQHMAAELTSQGYLLAASLAGHRNDLNARHYFSEQAFLYGKLAGDRNLQIAALRQLSITFDYLERPDKVLHVYEQAMPYLSETSPLLQACVYAGVSGAYAQLQQKQEALRFIGLAYEHFPKHPEKEPGFLHTICRYSTLIFFDGLNALGFGQPQEAEKILERIDGLQPKIPIPERVRIELLNYQIEVFTTLKYMEQACTYLEASVKTSLMIGSEKRFQEAFILFQQMQSLWRHEPKVQKLRSLFLQ